MATMIASLFAQIGADVSGFKKGAQEVKKDLGAMGAQTGKFAASSLLNWAAIGAAVAAAKKTFDFAKEGAQLDYAQTRFERLAKGAGSMSQVLMNDLRNATRGMYSDAELMASAGDLMALGLAKTHDEAVRLASVAGALDMNMNQLVLTMTNQTTMRFDALGVAVDGFDEKVEALIKTGMSAEDAFNEAFLRQAEEQIEKVGHAADTTLGAFKRLSAQGRTAWERFTTQLSKAFEGTVDRSADFLENINNTARAVSLLGAKFVQQTRDMQGNYHTVYELNGAYITLEELLRLADGALNKSAKAVRYAASSHGELESAALNVAAALGRVNDVNTNLIDSMQSMYNKARLAALGISEVEDSFENATARYMDGSLTLQQYNQELQNHQVAATLAALAAEQIGDDEAQAQLEGYGLKLAQIKELLDGISSGKYSAELIINLTGIDRGFSLAAAMAIAEDQSNGWAGLRNAQNAAQSAGRSLDGNVPGGANGGFLRPDGIFGHATGGRLGSKGPLVKVGEQGWEYAQYDPETNSWEIIPHNKSVQMEQEKAAGMANGGRLIDGVTSASGLISSQRYNSANMTLGGYYMSLGAQHPGVWHQNNPGVDKAWEQNNPGASWLQAAAQQAAQVAAQSAAAAVGASMATQSQQVATTAIAEFTREAKRANAKLGDSIEALRKDIQSLPLRIAAEISHELAIRNV